MKAEFIRYKDSFKSLKIGEMSIIRDFLENLGLFDKKDYKLKKNKNNKKTLEITNDGWILFSDNDELTFKLLNFLEKKIIDILIIDGNLNLGYTTIKSLPSGLFINDDLNLEKTLIKLLHNNLKVGRHCNLTYCKELKYLPDNLNIGGDLEIYRTNILKFPKNLRVEGNLYMEGNKYIDSFPKKMYIGGRLYCNNTKLAKKYFPKTSSYMMDKYRLDLFKKEIHIFRGIVNTSGLYI